ncbi:hypothetical protein [Heyndrickxia ginsengihumi]|uniref:Uncharacterized protein n=1 Tax=Heyndrickxia ginsengihumi TaxID=363870 RepID=A0A0A6XWR2_9BACI|nr:hypothetical protein [Heyndrickxia ginsengihumi]KHD84572.1 hypothetical protein NG54_14595 [Heyndrickxia ginsengihumi]MBE6184752.1 hypothetical protein [Bacillus sp. (in: firmicutes)]MCM3022962.1 hypothetical protein [Heyndrickxia ginsengihumi]NEY18912.1 hypothetical protein [Heyndrickxia ginsengihumi]
MIGCSVCNGIEEIQVVCPHCGSMLLDEGKIYDFYDDYSAYMDIDLLKLEDGDLLSSKKAECMHLLVCKQCQKEIEQKIPYRIF